MPVDTEQKLETYLLSFEIIFFIKSLVNNPKATLILEVNSEFYGMQLYCLQYKFNVNDTAHFP